VPLLYAFVWMAARRTTTWDWGLGAAAWCAVAAAYLAPLAVIPLVLWGMSPVPSPSGQQMGEATIAGGLLLACAVMGVCSFVMAKRL
jgi:hypothetical protein